MKKEAGLKNGFATIGQVQQVSSQSDASSQVWLQLHCNQHTFVRKLLDNILFDHKERSFTGVKRIVSVKCSSDSLFLACSYWHNGVDKCRV